MIRPILARLSRRHSFEYEDYTIEANKKMFAEYSILATPLILIIDGEKRIGTIVGHQTETSLESKLKQFGVIE
jgi:thioredoxin-related protein